LWICDREQSPSDSSYQVNGPPFHLNPIWIFFFTPLIIAAITMSEISLLCHKGYVKLCMVGLSSGLQRQISSVFALSKKKENKIFCQKNMCTEMSVLTRFSHPLIMCKNFPNRCFALSLGFCEIVHGGFQFWVTKTDFSCLHF
jgi:hypothetical protein